MRKASKEELEADREYIGALFKSGPALTGLAMIMAYALRDLPDREEALSRIVATIRQSWASKH